MNAHSPLDTFLSFYLLREYNRDITLQRMSDQLKAGASRDRNQTPEQVLATLEEIDPTRSKQYVMWLIREYGKQRFRLEDKPRLQTLLKNFERVKSRIQQKDINRYTLHELEDAVDAIVDPTLGHAQTNAPFVIPDEIKNDVEVLYNGPLGVLTIPKTEKASCVLGSGTKWCTAAQHNNRFDNYNKVGPLYIWRDKNGEKYQFHFSTLRFKDARDKPIETETFKQFRTSHPVLKKLFQRVVAKNRTDPEWASRYADRVIGGRWPEAEAVIATHHAWAYYYARDVIKGRWPEAESVIATDPEKAYQYAYRVIGGRWPEGEATIITDPQYAHYYAINVIGGRWPEAEAVIAKDPSMAYHYASDVIKGRWPEAETTIRQSSHWWERYRKIFMESRNTFTIGVSLVERNQTLPDITATDARRIGDYLGVDWNRVFLDQLQKGIVVELEHGDIIGTDYIAAAKIALAHLRELPDYYTRLSQMERG
jgi:hypothetical protein